MQGGPKIEAFPAEVETFQEGDRAELESEHPGADPEARLARRSACTEKGLRRGGESEVAQRCCHAGEASSSAP